MELKNAIKESNEETSDPKERITASKEETNESKKEINGTKEETNYPKETLKEKVNEFKEKITESKEREQMPKYTAPGFVDRYFKRYTAPTEHLYYYQHSNGLIVAGLLRDHPALETPPTALRFLFPRPRVGNDLRELGNLVAGKRKRGGAPLRPKQIVCNIESGGKLFEIPSLIKGTVIELNAQLLGGELNAIRTDPEESGFLFIAAPPRETDTLATLNSDLVCVPSSFKAMPQSMD